jgi:hypothetical protein
MGWASLAQFFSQNFRQDSRQVCRPSVEIADKFVGLVLIFSVTGSARISGWREREACGQADIQNQFFNFFVCVHAHALAVDFGHTKNQTQPTSLSA